MCIWESERSQIPSQASQHTLCHLCHQRRTGSRFKTFNCTSPVFHSSYKPSTYQHSPCLWPRRSSRTPLISFSLKAISSQGQEDVQGQTELYWPASKLMEPEVNMIVVHKAPGMVWRIRHLIFMTIIGGCGCACLPSRDRHEKCMQVDGRKCQ